MLYDQFTRQVAKFFSSYPTSFIMSLALQDQKLEMSQDEVAFPPTPPETVVDGEDSESTRGDEKEVLSFALPPPSTVPEKVLDIDGPTPDSHVPRDPRLIRLTGVHPFNVEAPLPALFNEGFLTSPELFYVRNHGAVPVVREEDIPNWEFSVEGYVMLLLPHSTREITRHAGWWLTLSLLRSKSSCQILKM